MAISRETVVYVANLARMELREEEVIELTGQLDRILEYVHKLKTIDVEKLRPTSHVLVLKNVYRDDKVKAPLDVNMAIKNAPSLEGNLFKVQKIIE